MMEYVDYCGIKIMINVRVIIDYDNYIYFVKCYGVEKI